jgi:hypothetical protein
VTETDPGRKAVTSRRGRESETVIKGNVQEEVGRKAGSELEKTV